ncbi:PolC-type DNA polymerase III [Desulfuribacillus stibiiarsenatis]|uniref:DNA polymerase III PolC-type n=1 Tax=Desulfuribacillus stibiiarsenatis TaxID=1390249 RepID=A0A1E5L759_9FIRM|nr:PolC-type DNA polymerase III [Desulfuribacillus stibiiarsenatis]OEH85854.1 PolC-type DNA polymerase III [Desulfuribacillus stibiiarsenatis]
MISKQRQNFLTLTEKISYTHLDSPYFVGALIEKVEIQQDQKVWHVYFQLPQVLPVAILKDFCFLLHETYKDMASIICYFCYENDCVNDEVIKEYWNHYLWPQLLMEQPYLNGWLTKFTSNYLEKSVVLYTLNDLGKTTLQQKNVPQWVANCFRRFLGIDVKIQLEGQENSEKVETFLAEKKKDEDFYIQQLLSERSHFTDEKVDPNTRNDNKQGNGTLSNIIIGKEINHTELQKLSNLSEMTDQMSIEGRVFNIEKRVLKSGKHLVSFNLTDETDSIKVKVFLKDDKQLESIDILEQKPYARTRGLIQYDTFDKQIVLMAKDIVLASPKERMDRSERKRIELHLHTPMSSMDGVSSVKSLISTAAKWGHKAIAITDHGVVQAFPEAHEVAQKHNIKLIYGVEAYLVNDGIPIVHNCRDMTIDEETTYVVFDTETTGLSAVENCLTEIAAVKVRNNEIIDFFQSLIRPKERISEKIEKLTGISNQMVANAPELDIVLKDFINFCGESVMVAHNASFDMNFVNTSLDSIGLKSISMPVIDTVAFARFAIPGLKSYKLNNLCKELNIELEQHHRALFDATATAKLLIELLKKIDVLEIDNLRTLNEQVVEFDMQKLRPYHCILLAKNQIGLKNLYKLISLSHIKYFHRQPRIPKSELVRLREGIIVGSACEAGELYQAMILKKSDQEIQEVAKFYDYLEIQPLGNNDFMVQKGIVEDYSKLKDINRNIYMLGKQLNKPVVATGDVHFLNPSDAKFREILMASKGFSDAADQPPLYLKTTEEMLDEFSYLGTKEALEVVVDTPEMICEQVEALKPFPDELFTPVIEGADEQIRNMSYEKARNIYGEVLPAIVEDRLKFELDSIIGNGFAVIYLISHKIVTKSLRDGYLVGSRGSVGSSFVATMTDITEVNPLPPHYICTKCKKSIFITDGSIGSGFDLPNRDCPDCNIAMLKEGHDIPFETFMGFKGDKVPDIDLNFSGEYQPNAHKYVEELFGRDYVFRAGTISTVAEKTAYGYVQKYAEEKNIVLRNAEIERLIKGCSGIKRTTGQHPGGQMVIPNYKDVHDFTPIQFPADSKDSAHYTTHFDYHAISGRLLKLDILGHDDPTVIRMLQDLTGINPNDIPIDDPLTMSLFSTTQAIEVSSEELNSPVATFGVPEFGTKFVRQMLEDTRPTTFAELVRISGLSHGTDVWLNNAQELIKAKKAVLAEVISTRDDIMVYLIHKGLEPSTAFKIMEKVRKGKGLQPEDEEEMSKHHVPDWYIWSCNQIKYMFPKAHAVAYVLMAVRIAYFKVHYPLQFYSAYFSVRADDFDIDIMIHGKQAIANKLKEIQEKGNLATTKEKNLATVLEVAYEMTTRGYRFYPIQLHRSDALKFQIYEEGLIPPFASLAGVGKAAAQGIAAACEDGNILSVEDFQEKSKISKTVIELLKERGCLEDLPDTNQLSLF